VPDGALAGAERATVPRDVSIEIRDRYVAFRRAQAELAAWLEFSGDQHSATETELRNREALALDALVKSPASTFADLAVKLQILKDQASVTTAIASNDILRMIADDGLRLTRPIREIEARVTALRLTMTLLLNAAAGDRQSLERARAAVLDLIEAPASPCASNPQLKQAAKDEVGALFKWVD
jgi:hypothetical protein